MERLRRFGAADTHRKVNIALSLRVQPLVDVHRAVIIAIDPNRPAVVGKPFIF